MSIVLFETTADERRALPSEVRALVRLEERTLQECADEHSDCRLAIVEVRSRVTAGLLSRLPLLEHVASRTTGLDHIDQGACARRGVRVTHAGGYCAEAVAEFSVALILHLLRGPQITHGVSGRLRPGLAGRVAGVLGAGRIGRSVAEALSALGCRVLVSSRRPVPGLEVTPVETIFREATVISVHLPGEAGLALGPREFSLLRPDAVVVNTARAGAIDHEVLLEALTAGRLAAAALDVGPWEADEGWLDRPPVRALREQGRLVVTPHVAWATERSFEEQLSFVVRTILAETR